MQRYLDSQHLQLAKNLKVGGTGSKQGTEAVKDRETEKIQHIA